MASINEKSLDHLLALARLDVSKKDKPKLAKDLGSILDYFESLQRVNTDAVEPMTGGTRQHSVVRLDEVNIDLKHTKIGEAGRIIEAFPDKKGGYMKVPGVFE